MAIHVPVPEQEKEHIEWMRVALEQVGCFPPMTRGGYTIAVHPSSKKRLKKP